MQCGEIENLQYLALAGESFLLLDKLCPPGIAPQSCECRPAGPDNVLI